MTSNLSSDNRRKSSATDSVYSVASSEYSGGQYLKRLASTLSVMGPGDMNFGNALICRLIVDLKICMITQQELNSLPDFYQEPQSWTKKTSCQICRDQYTLVANRQHHCICSRCGGAHRFLDKRREKKYRVCIRCDVITLNKELFNAYQNIKDSLHTEIQQLKNKLEGTDKDLGEMESCLKMMKSQLISERQKHESRKTKLGNEICNLTDHLKTKKNQLQQLTKYVKGVEQNLSDVNGIATRNRDAIAIKREEIKQKNGKIEQLDKEIELEQKSLSWKMTVKKKRQSSDGPQDAQSDLIKSKHKITMEEIKESICESVGTNSFGEENTSIAFAFKSEINGFQQREFSIDQMNSTYLTQDPKNN